ncbi:MAG: response regulator [Desulfuromonadales bacterium]|nr:response regulator [Desulfuromonadales bacterium]
MSLVGNLEDLGLGEILQIVSLSRKSGVLELSSVGRDGRVIFHDGQVIRATSTTFPENLGDLVVRDGLADLSTLKKAVALQHESPEERRIGDILVSDFGVEREALESAVREQVERIVYSFFSWDEGSFSFELGDPGELAMTIMNPLLFMLDQGLNPQWLAMEGSRILDEKRHRGESFEEQGESLVDFDKLLAEVRGDAPPDAAQSVAASPQDSDSTDDLLTATNFIVVDDDPNTAEQIAALLQKRKAQVHVFTNVLSFMEAVREADPLTTTLVIDLIMPRRDGSGVLGGLELLEEVRRDHPGFRVMVMSDHPNADAEQSVRKFGVPALFPKPTRSDVIEPRGLDGLVALVDAMVTYSASGEDAPKMEREGFNIGAELMRELGETASASSTTPQQTPGLHLLRGMLQELNNPSLGGGIILLILRFASELMNRAVILLVKDEEIVGLGQFGIELDGESPDVKVRETCLPMGEENLFSTALQTLSPYKVCPEDNQWNTYLFDQLGGHRPEEIFVGPLISEGRVVAVLYGDNLPDAKEIGDTESLEIFLSQAGLAMEKALLERRMMSSKGA